MNPLPTELEPTIPKPDAQANHLFVRGLIWCVGATVMYTLTWVGMFLAGVLSIGSYKTPDIVYNVLSFVQNASAVVSSVALIVAIFGLMAWGLARARKVS